MLQAPIIIDQLSAFVENQKGDSTNVTFSFYDNAEGNRSYAAYRLIDAEGSSSTFGKILETKWVTINKDSNPYTITIPIINSYASNSFQIQIMTFLPGTVSIDKKENFELEAALAQVTSDQKTEWSSIVTRNRLEQTPLCNLIVNNEFFPSPNVWLHGQIQYLNEKDRVSYYSIALNGQKLLNNAVPTNNEFSYLFKDNFLQPGEYTITVEYCTKFGYKSTQETKVNVKTTESKKIIEKANTSSGSDIVAPEINNLEYFPYGTGSYGFSVSSQYQKSYTYWINFIDESKNIIQTNEITDSIIYLEIPEKTNIVRFSWVPQDGPEDHNPIYYIYHDYIQNVNCYISKDNCYQILLKFDIQTENNNLFNGLVQIERLDEAKNEIIYMQQSFEQNHVMVIDYNATLNKHIQYRIIVQDSEGYSNSRIINIKTPQASEQDIILMDGNQALHIIYDSEINSLKYNTQDSIINTLGGQYPYIRRNGSTYYKTFNISGLISYHSEMDEFNESIETSLTTAPTIGKIPISTFEYSSMLKDIQNTQDSEINLERIFRERVIQFLHNDRVKLFKSPTEGNMLIKLTNISLSPKKELGRMIYSFSAQATEIAEATEENLKKYQINREITQELFDKEAHLWIQQEV